MNLIRGVLDVAARGARAALATGWPVFALGLVLSSVGLYQAWPPLGLIWPGIILMALTLFGPRGGASQ